MVCRSTNRGAATANTNGGIKMKASALNKMESCDRDESIIQAPQQIRLDYVEQNDDDTGGITLGEEVAYLKFFESSEEVSVCNTGRGHSPQTFVRFRYCCLLFRDFRARSEENILGA